MPRQGLPAATDRLGTVGKHRITFSNAPAGLGTGDRRANTSLCLSSKRGKSSKRGQQISSINSQTLNILVCSLYGNHSTATVMQKQTWSTIK